MSTAKDLQEKIEQCRKKISEFSKPPYLADKQAQIAGEQAEMFAAASQLAEISTGRIIALTRALCWLTVVLLVTSIVTLAVIFK